MMKSFTYYLALFGLAAGVVGVALGWPVEQQATIDSVDEHADDYSQAPLFPGDDGETAYMPEHYKPIFADFCINARDEIKSSLSSDLGERSQKIVNVFMNKLQEVATDTLNAKIEALSSGQSTASNNNNKKIDQVVAADVDQDGQLSEEELANKISDDIERNQAMQEARPGVIKRFAQGIIGALQFIVKAFLGEGWRYLDEVRKEVGSAGIIAAVENACNQLNFSLHMKLQQMFQTTRSELQKSARRNKNAELEKILASTNLGSLQCVTTSRVLTVQAACDTVKNYTPMLKLFTSKAGL